MNHGMKRRGNTVYRLFAIQSVLQGSSYRFRREAGVTVALLDQIAANRKLLHLLQCEAPELLDRNPWVAECFAQRDDWLRDLALAASIDLQVKDSVRR